MKTFGTLALIFFVSTFAHGEDHLSAGKRPAESASDRGPNIIRIQLIPSPHRDVPSPNKRPDPEAINNCHTTNNSCEAAKEGLPMAAQIKKGGCCYVNWVDCLNGAGAKSAPPKDDKYAEELEACYSQETPELKVQILQQCTAKFDEAQQKALDTWTPHHKRNGTVAFSFKDAKSCVDRAQHSCLSGTTGLFNNVVLSCCMAGNCDQLAKEVLHDEKQKCSNITDVTCLVSAANKAKDARAKCEAAYQCVPRGVPLP